MVPGENNQIVAIQGMCATATAAADEPRALCIIRDMSNSQWDSEKVAVNLPVSTTASQLMEEVGRKFHYHPDTFELVLQRTTDKEIISIHEYTEETLGDLGFRCGEGARNSLIINNKNLIPPSKVEMTETGRTLAEDLWVERKTSYTYVPPPAPPPYTPASSEFSYNFSSNNSLTRHDTTGFVGLVNQAMTCYLNSLLQTLFMTPEFRNALYRWEFDGTEEEGTKSIPFQLQKLFLQLQTSKKPAVGTTELTTSFGWDSSEAWHQHDVQELCRVMFDALEQKFKNTEQADLISRLYEGKLKDYVKCLQCGYESAREDTFLDVPLVVRPFGSSQAYASVEEALQAFVTPEILQGSNQYFCEHCNKKCDAHKGLKFIRFPYLLTLQLKRFDFDPVTMHRIKLNDRVSFPEILNLNEFITEKSSSGNDIDEMDNGSSTLEDESMNCATGYSSGFDSTSDSSDLVDDDEGIDCGPHVLENSHESTVNERNLKKSMEKGPYVYELFSIMVHSGSANGGHYYAYIKSFRHGEWYCFNDAQVTKITYDDIQKTYGGPPSRGYYSSAYSSSTNAYMLMYRQIDRQKNTDCMTLNEFPEHITDLLQCMQAEEERERQQRELERSMCKIKLYCQYPNAYSQRMMERKLKVHKDTTLAEATRTAHTMMGLEGMVDLECCRLVKYDDFQDSIECSFDGCENEAMGNLLGGVKSSYKFDLLLEIRKPEEQFQVYKPGGSTIKVHIVDLENEEVAVNPLTIRSNPTSTVEDLKSQISQALGVDGSKMRIVLETYTNETKILDVLSKTLNSEGFKKSNKVFVEYKDHDDAEKPYTNSKLFKVLDCYAHTICIYVALPKIDKAALEKLRIRDNCTLVDKCDSSSDDEKGEESNDSSSSAGDQKGQCNSNQVASKVNSVPGASKSISETLWSENSKSVHNSINVEFKKSSVMITSDDPFQDYDEGLGDSEIGDSVSSNGYQSNQAIHSDQSEDSSLTDSERTLIGDESSPRNNSPEMMTTEMEQDLEPLENTSMEVSKPECDSLLSQNGVTCALNRQDKSRNLSSPEENTKDSKNCDHLSCCKNLCTSPQPSVSDERVKCYFRAWSYTDYETGEKMLRVYVDKRITLGEVKRELESHVGIPADYFKIFRVYSNNQEFECTRLTDNLMSYNDDSKLTLKLGRALRKGEYKVKIYQLTVNEREPFKFLIDWVVIRGLTVLKAKKDILPEIKERCGLDIPLNRCRLRKKNWKSPGTIFLDHQRFDKDITVNTSWEMFLEFLTDAETVTSDNQLALFVKRWHPSTYQLDPFKEIVLQQLDVKSLRQKLSEMSGIPAELIEFAKGQGTFPCEVSLLTIHKELEWYTQQATLCEPLSLSIGDDGHVIYYRDKSEELKKLTEEEKREINNKENARSNKNTKKSYSPRKEKALKIYTVDSSSSNSSTSNSSTNIADNLQSIVPDLD